MNKKTPTKKLDLLKKQTTNKINVNDILFDIEYFLKEYYYASFYKEENSLSIKLITGEKFKISIT